MATTKSEPEPIFENVEFVDPQKQSEPAEQPSHPLTQPTTVNRKRKQHPSQSQSDAPFTRPPPSKRPKTTHTSSKWHTYQQPTIQEMESHPLYRMAKQNWLHQDTITFNPSLVSQLYFEHITSQNTESKHDIMILEFSQYLETYLWKFFDFESSSNEHILSIIYFINQKFEQRTPVWSVLCTKDNMDKLSAFFNRIFAMKLDELDLYLNDSHTKHSTSVWDTDEKSQFVLFLMHCFYTMENESVRAQILKLVGLPLFAYLDDKQRQKIFVFVPSLAKSWKKYSKNKSKIPRHQKELYWLLFQEFFVILKETESLYKVLKDTNTSNGHGNANLDTLNMEYTRQLNYIYNFCQLLVDNLCILMTRRYLRPLLQSSNILFLIQCKYLVSPLLYESDRLFHTMIEKIAFYLGFEVDDFDGRSLSDNEMRLESHHKLMVLQKCVFKYFYDALKAMALCTISSLDDYDKLKEYLCVLSVNDLYTLCDKLHIMPQSKAQDMKQLLSSNELNRKQGISEADVLMEILIAHHLSRPSKRQQIANLPLYPTERMLFDDGALFVDDKYNVLGLDKLNLQFLSIYDYLLRNYNLYRLESAHSIRDDIAKAIYKIRPRLKRNSNTKRKDTIFTGYSRFALPVDEFSIVSVDAAHLGETKPSKVMGEIAVDLKVFKDEIYSEWTDLRVNDVLFVVRVVGVSDVDSEDYMKRWDELSMKELGIAYVRGCHIVFIRDGDSPQHVMNEYDLETGEKYTTNSTKRIYDVAFDCAQYQLDIESMVENENCGDIYSYFNLLIRRKGKENNFKSVLRCITSLMTSSNNLNVYHDQSQAPHDQYILPQWFQPLFLGYGSPQSAAYYKIHPAIAPPPSIPSAGAVPEEVKDHYCLDFKYSLFDLEHVKRSFVGKQVRVLGGGDAAQAPFKIWFDKKHIAKPDYEAILNASFESEARETSDDVIYVEPYCDAKANAFGREKTKRNSIRFTPIQVEAIKSGMHYGLSVVVGPPGSGKTDVAVQIISNLYANFGETERILLVTHSNSALNDLFCKLMQREIDERHVLRLGYGNTALEGDYSRKGRIDYMLNDRLNKLQIAQFLAKTLGVSGYCHTAETAAHFRNIKLQGLWEEFEEELDAFEDRFADKLSDDSFVISQYKSYQNIAISAMIAALFPFVAFIEQLLSTLGEEKAVFMANESYSFNKSLAYQYWAYIVGIFRDIAQCHVFELLRTTKDRSQYLLTRQSAIVAMTVTHAAIKRDELIGNKLEYDTLIMEEAAQILDIETFIPMTVSQQRLKRIILIGDHHQLPPIIKNRAFAAYSKLDESLFHRLVRLGTPHHLLNMQGRCRPSIRSLWSWNYPYAIGDLSSCDFANAGFCCSYQLIGVDGEEHQPSPYFYQNISEAEYVVNCFMFMRLIGYPRDKITILSTYNGQKHLIADIVNKKCASDPLFGAPHCISTVDEYQGSQNDFVLLSLVRTRSVGHLRDVRRLIVALSRAKYGLYVFAKTPLFEECAQLTKAFDLLTQRPQQLRLLTNESYPTKRALNDTAQYEQVTNIAHFMTIVNRMADAKRDHAQNEYKQQMMQYKQRALSVLQQRDQQKEKQNDDELNEEEQFDLAAQMALQRSKQTIENDEEYEENDDDIDMKQTSTNNNKKTPCNDSPIEYESSSSDDGD
eukprot:863101_1